MKLLEGVLSIFSKCALKSLNNQADFDSAIRRFDPSRPSQSREGTPQVLVKHEASRQTRSLSSNREASRQTKRPPEGGLSVALIEIENQATPRPPISFTKTPHKRPLVI
jgi:hypothetical protein